MRIIPRLDISKLTLEYRGRQIKIEVNQTKRGIIGGKPLLLHLSQKAQDDFEMDVKMRIVPLTLLYGGKIAAALSRQHPRDLFDIRHMSIPLPEAKHGFIFCLLGSDRPLHESFAPSLIDQSEAMVNQFEGMSEIPFSYDDFTATRERLIEDINEILTPKDKDFLISFEKAEPDWQDSPYTEFENYPSVKWK
ncbi:MAG: nucleotidyl transferase AbiEii/AbiGii toxin family protein [Muribaculaceae bacterium]|nr:nucleotidyl transferase AbiEii/AbiGii toxin family protein [Muribaculaceae bacterium]